MYVPPGSTISHRIITWPILGPDVYAVTLPVPFGRTVILVRSQQSWWARPDQRAHEYVHLEQIDRLGGCGYIAAHARARVRSVYAWLGGERRHGGGWRGFFRAFWAEDQPIEREAYSEQRRMRDLVTASNRARTQSGRRNGRTQ